MCAHSNTCLGNCKHHHTGGCSCNTPPSNLAARRPEWVPLPTNKREKYAVLSIIIINSSMFIGDSDQKWVMLLNNGGCFQLEICDVL